IARESVQVKEKTGKGRAGPPPLCACQGVPSAGSGNGMPVYPDRDSPMAGTSPWPCIVPGRVHGVGKPPVEPYAAHRGSGCFSGNGGTGMPSPKKDVWIR
ncbi:MAG: hypothetical protein OXC82_08290, partial [Rhodobacteraceae bacterium]|nr:hypothetical protein [Paracoccaceae bacterium]